MNKLPQGVHHKTKHCEISNADVLHASICALQYMKHAHGRRDIEIPLRRDRVEEHADVI